MNNYYLLWLNLYYFGRNKTKHPSYILASVHTGRLLYNGLQSRVLTLEQIKRILGWSKSYFITDALISGSFIISDILKNIRNNKSILNINIAHLGYLIHHYIAYNFLSIYDNFDYYVKQESQNEFNNILRLLEVSNVFLYLTYFLYERFGKNHWISKISLLTETSIYTYIRVFLLGKFLLQNGNNLYEGISIQFIILYGLSCYWSYSLCIQSCKTIMRK